MDSISPLAISFPVFIPWLSPLHFSFSFHFVCLFSLSFAASALTWQSRRFLVFIHVHSPLFLHSFYLHFVSYSLCTLLSFIYHVHFQRSVLLPTLLSSALTSPKHLFIIFFSSSHSSFRLSLSSRSSFSPFFVPRSFLISYGPILHRVTLAYNYSDISFFFFLFSYLPLGYSSYFPFVLSPILSSVSSLFVHLKDVRSFSPKFSPAKLHCLPLHLFIASFMIICLSLRPSSYYITSFPLTDSNFLIQLCLVGFSSSGALSLAPVKTVLA